MAATKIIVKNNGSIRVEGDFEIVDESWPLTQIAHDFVRYSPPLFGDVVSLVQATGTRHFELA